MRQGARTKKVHPTIDGGIQKQKAARTPRKGEKTWEKWDPRLIALYVEYDLSQTEKTLAEEGFKAKPRQLRHRIEKLGLGDKYKTANHEANLKRGRKKIPGEEEVPPGTLIELSQFWLALAAENKAFPLLTLLYHTCIDKREMRRAARAAIARARTALQPGQKLAARRELIRMASSDKTKRRPDHFGLLADSQDPASVSRAHVFSGYHAYTYAHGERKTADDPTRAAPEKPEVSEAPRRAAVALKHLFGPDERADEPKFSDNPLGTHLDFLSYFATWYCLGASQDEVVIRSVRFSDRQRERIQGKCLAPQLAIRDMDTGMGPPKTHVVRACIGWMKQSFQSGEIIIPAALKEVPTEDCKMWRDELEVFVAVWHHYLRSKNSSLDDGWSQDCEEHLSIYPAELISLILRRAMEEISSPKQEGHPFMTPPADDLVSNSGSRASSTFLPPIPAGSPRSLSPRPPVSPRSVGSGRRRSTSQFCTEETVHRREKLVQTVGKCIQRLADLVSSNEKDIWECLLDWFVDMNRLDNLAEGDVRFKQDMVGAIDEWVNQEVKKYVPASSPQPSPLLAPPLQLGAVHLGSSMSDIDDEEMMSPSGGVLSLGASDQDEYATSESYDMDMDEDMDEDSETYACTQQSVYPEPDPDKSWVGRDFD